MNPSMVSEDPQWRRALIMAIFLNALWINISEWWRYLAFVMPLMRANLPQVRDVAPMSLSVGLVWEAWGTLLVLSVTAFAWMYFGRFGGGLMNALLAGTALWAAIFGIFWIALFNMNLATPNVVLTALPLAWIEMAVAALIVDLCRQKLARV